MPSDKTGGNKCRPYDGGYMRVSLLLTAMAGVAVGCASIRRAPPVATAQITGAGGVKHDTLMTQLLVKVPGDTAAIQAIMREEAQHSQVDSNIEYLSDIIGPRVTGSNAAEQAVQWTAHQFKAYGLDSVWTESWLFGRPWERGPIALTLLRPQGRQLIGASWAWAPGTPGPEIGDVMMLKAQNADEYADVASSVRGKWVMTRAPSFVWNSDGPPMTHADSLAADSAHQAILRLAHDTAALHFRQRLLPLLAHDGALGVLYDGAKEFGLLTMSGSPTQMTPLPFVVLQHETFAQFARVLARGDTVRLRADIANTLGDHDVNSENTVAEIRGSVHPDEVVLLGAHLDSWDLAEGTTDNGTGAIAVLEAARALAASHVKPQRTIRFVLFTGEEEGLFGSQHYAVDHASELPKYQAVLVLDNGTGRITGMSLQGHNDMYDLWQSLFAPLSSTMGPFTIQARDKTGTDHLSFIPFGVPSFNYDQMVRGYNHTHHSQADTYEYALPGDLQQAATVMAVTAYELANLPSLLPRGPVTVHP